MEENGISKSPTGWEQIPELLKKVTSKDAGPVMVFVVGAGTILSLAKMALDTLNQRGSDDKEA